MVHGIKDIAHAGKLLVMVSGTPFIDILERIFIEVNVNPNKPTALTLVRLGRSFC